MATSVQQNLESKNAEYVSSFTQGDLELPPAKKYLVLTCMDARIDPAAAFGIELGDAHVVRNAGATARVALRDILISQQLLGTQEVLIVKHTGCGMLLFNNDVALGLVEKNLGEQTKEGLVAQNFDFHTITSLETAAKDDVAWLKGSGYIDKHVPVTGWIYDVKTGKVNKVA